MMGVDRGERELQLKVTERRVSSWRPFLWPVSPLSMAAAGGVRAKIEAAFGSAHWRQPLRFPLGATYRSYS